MKTVIPKRDDLYRKYFPNKSKNPAIYDCEPEKRMSCFYDFGVRREVGFGEIITPSEDKDYED